MADSLRKLTGRARDRAFYAMTIQHHEEAVRMVDDFQPRLKDTEVREMSTTMRADQAREIAEFRRKLQ